MEGPIGRMLREAAIMSECGCFAAIFTLCHELSSFRFILHYDLQLLDARKNFTTKRTFFQSTLFYFLKRMFDNERH